MPRENKDLANLTNKSWECFVDFIFYLNYIPQQTVTKLLMCSTLFKTTTHIALFFILHILYYTKSIMGWDMLTQALPQFAIPFTNMILTTLQVTIEVTVCVPPL